MPANIILYPPGGGGNHLKNLCYLADCFQNQWPWPWIQQQWVGTQPYDHPVGPSGTVHSLLGRNVHKVFMDHISQNPTDQFLLHGHFGELALHADAIRSWRDVMWLVITMDQDLDRQLLRSRQERLQYHPYWLDEEQIYLYRPSMCEHYFKAEPGNITEMALHQFWASDLVASGTIDRIHKAFGIDIDIAQACELHAKWCQLNSETDRDLT